MALESTSPNAEMVDYWGETAGPKWVRLQTELDAHLSPLLATAIEELDLTSGSAVLDVGCGCGATTLELARRVGEDGRVVGMDISAPMLARARQRAEAAKLAQVGFELADAQARSFAAEFDAVHSRFGVMFFSDPVSAFTNLRRAVRPGGRLAFTCWQALDKNPWMLVPVGVVAQHVELDLPTDPYAPGPFAFADEERTRSIVCDAGWADVRVDSKTGQLAMAGATSISDAVEFISQLGPAAAALKDADESLVARVEGSLHEALAPHHGAGGVVMDYAVWIVQARAAD